VPGGTLRSGSCRRAIETSCTLIPRRHLEDCLAARHPGLPPEPRRLTAHDDPVLCACVARLAARPADAPCTTGLRAAAPPT